jgi:hypothetical protein
MLNAIFDCPAVALSRVAPIPIGQEVLIRSALYFPSVTVDVDCKPTLIARTAELVLDALKSAVRLDQAVLHRHGSVRLVIGEPGHFRYQWQRHQLANEYDSGAVFFPNFSPHIKAEIHFLEVLVKEGWQSKQAGVEEEEPDQTDEMTAVVAVELCASGDVGQENLGVYHVIQHRDVSPVRGQEPHCHRSASSFT